jgi:hypothetical protein
MGTRLHNYKEVREYLEPEHPDWLQALTPRHINAPADYWPQKVLAVSSVNAATSASTNIILAAQIRRGRDCRCFFILEPVLRFRLGRCNEGADVR